MQKKVSVGVFTVCILLAILLSVMTTFVLTRESFVTRARTSDNSAENLAAKLTELDGRFNQHYIGETDYETAEKYVMSAYLAGTGDKYAAYYTAEEYKEMMSASYGDSEGIGVSVIYNSEYGVIQIVEIFPDSPALAAGLEIGDLIAYIGIGENRESVAEIGYDAALTKLRGAAGTTAEFTVVRGENYETEVEFSIERGHYSEQTVLSHLYSKDTSVGVIRISQFEGVTPEQFKNAVSELTAEGAKKLIVDLRNNPGGDRDSICQVLDCILPEGPLLRVKQSDGEIEVTNTSDASCIDIPIAVVVNGNTASAAELFTSAMRDYGRAKIVGTTTYGKGCMQTFYPLSDGSVFKVTTAMYYPPYSDNYDGVGIVPDREVELDESLHGKSLYVISDEEDNQLAAAYDILK